MLTSPSRRRSFAAPFFAFHNEFGMVHFLLHPKGRCRCYNTLVCDVVSDGGYNLWSTKKHQPASSACPAEVPPRLRGENDAGDTSTKTAGVSETDMTAASSTVGVREENTVHEVREATAKDVEALAHPASAVKKHSQSTRTEAQQNGVASSRSE